MNTYSEPRTKYTMNLGRSIPRTDNFQNLQEVLYMLK